MRIPKDTGEQHENRTESGVLDRRSSRRFELIGCCRESRLSSYFDRVAIGSSGPSVAPAKIMQASSWPVGSL